jgi:hypothetical protein
MLSGEVSEFMWDASFCVNPLGPPVNLCITGAEGRDCIVLVQSLHPVSVLSSLLSL